MKIGKEALMRELFVARVETVCALREFLRAVEDGEDGKRMGKVRRGGRRSVDGTDGLVFINILWGDVFVVIELGRRIGDPDNDGYVIIHTEYRIE